MSNFVTYSQNCEDLMLWRALRHIERGTYIDIGANHPSKDSVTKAFYDRGWSGMNIEPEKRFFKLLKRERIRDINVQCAVSHVNQEIPFYQSKIRGRSTTESQIINSQDQKRLFLLDKVIMVPAKTLDWLCEEYDIQTVHFLKIDVEGAEKDVLESFSFQSIRPWIVLIEATAPGTNEDISSSWEYILLSKNYQAVYFDGINKYFLANEHLALKDAFVVPPNILDGYIHADYEKSLLDLQQIERLLQQKQYENKNLEDRVQHLSSTIERVSTEKEYYKNLFEQLIQSKSWKITLPLRIFMSWLKPKAPIKVEQKKEEFIPVKNDIFSSYLQKAEDLSEEAYCIYQKIKNNMEKL